MKKDGLLCWKCQKIVSYTVSSRKRIRNIGECRYEYMEKYGTCDICGEEISVPGLDDENERLLDSIYRADHDLITVDEINSILEKYNIEKRPLSHVLGMGEHTISRYMEGAMPNRKYSDLLRKLLAYHGLMRNYLDKNRDKITDAAYNKTNLALSEIEALCAHNTKTELVALYIIHKAYEVTDLSLQKMLYFVKGYSWALMRKDMIEEDCEAWAYGPVFPAIYEKYKVLGSGVISDYDQTIEYEKKLTPEELELLDHIIHCFGIYNGSVLMRITHKESPWKEAREGIPEFVASSNVIKSETIYTYFDEINKKYDLGKIEGVKKYIKRLGVV